MKKSLFLFFLLIFVSVFSQINVQVLDENGTPISNAKVSYNNQNYSTNEKGLVKVPVTETEQNLTVEKENWIKFLDPINLFGEILRSIKAGGLIGCIGAIIVYVPLPFFLITYLFGFFIFFEYYNFTLLNSDVHYTALINIIFSIWIFVILLPGGIN